MPGAQLDALPTGQDTGPSKLPDKNGVKEKCQDPSFRYLAEVFMDSQRESPTEEKQWARNSDRKTRGITGGRHPRPQAEQTLSLARLNKVKSDPQLGTA